MARLDTLTYQCQYCQYQGSPKYKNKVLVVFNNSFLLVVLVFRYKIRLKS